jgi:hypothetical protein
MWPKRVSNPLFSLTPFEHALLFHTRTPSSLFFFHSSFLLPPFLSPDWNKREMRDRDLLRVRDEIEREAKRAIERDRESER